MEPQFSEHYTNWAEKGIVHRRPKTWEGLVPSRMSGHERSKWIHHLDEARGGAHAAEGECEHLKAEENEVQSPS